MLVLLIPLFALAIPLSRILPSLYGWRVRSRIYKWYGQLKFLEEAWRRDPAARSREEWLKEIDTLEARVCRSGTAAPGDRGAGYPRSGAFVTIFHDGQIIAAGGGKLMRPS